MMSVQSNGAGGSSIGEKGCEFVLVMSVLAQLGGCRDDGGGKLL